MQVHGLHHVTAVTADAPGNLDFYTRVLGLRLVKKTVNQDDVSAYHLFYADKLGSPGTDMTFFDWPLIGEQEHGTDSIAETAFRVNGRAALDYWVARFNALGVAHEPVQEWAGFARLPFTDPEGQRLALVDDGGAQFEGEVWDGSDVPMEHAIRGFWGVTLSVPNLARYEPIFSLLMGWERVSEAPGGADVLYAMDGGGPGRYVRVIDEGRATRAQLGAGGVHHVAFRVRDEDEQRAWMGRLNELGVPHSGEVNRYYFRSLYFRISNGILFELATDGPGFTADEPLETLGQRLALPPFLEPRRAQIEAGLKPLD
jgi:glyoxalase family protein